MKTLTLSLLIFLTITAICQNSFQGNSLSNLKKVENEAYIFDSLLWVSIKDSTTLPENDSLCNNSTINSIFVSSNVTDYYKAPFKINDTEVYQIRCNCEELNLRLELQETQLFDQVMDFEPGYLEFNAIDSSVLPAIDSFCYNPVLNELFNNFSVQSINLLYGFDADEPILRGLTEIYGDFVHYELMLELEKYDTLITNIRMIGQCYPDLGIFWDKNEIVINIFPNPFDLGVNISSNTSEPKSIQIYNISGQLIEQRNFTDTVYFDTSSFNKGIYLVRIVGQNNLLELKTIIKL
jgi:hypothetical protein